MRAGRLVVNIVNNWDWSFSHSISVLAIYEQNTKWWQDFSIELFNFRLDIRWNKK